MFIEVRLVEGKCGMVGGVVDVVDVVVDVMVSGTTLLELELAA